MNAFGLLANIVGGGVKGAADARKEEISSAIEEQRRLNYMNLASKINRQDAEFQNSLAMARDDRNYGREPVGLLNGMEVSRDEYKGLTPEQLAEFKSTSQAKDDAALGLLEKQLELKSRYKDAPDDPAELRLFNAVKGMSPEDQALYVRMKGGGKGAEGMDPQDRAKIYKDGLDVWNDMYMDVDGSAKEGAPDPNQFAADYVNRAIGGGAVQSGGVNEDAARKLIEQILAGRKASQFTPQASHEKTKPVAQKKSDEKKSRTWGDALGDISKVSRARTDEEARKILESMGQ